LNAIPKIVFSKTLDRAPWGGWPDAKIVKTSAAKEVEKLKEAPGKDMVIWGSLSLAQSLINEGLVDEYQLFVCPLVLGTGTPLFREKVDSLDMKLLETRSFDRGAVLLAYAPAEARSFAAAG
jgi:dihydrofolate reductase